MTNPDCRQAGIWAMCWATISDKKNPVDDGAYAYDFSSGLLEKVGGPDGVLDYYKADVVTANDYYPFGMVMPGRKYTSSSSSYRYGFNGKENDNEVKGEGGQQDYGMRIYDPRLGRFLSVDPLASGYPWFTPYQFAGNSPIENIDLDGLEDTSAIIPRFSFIPVIAPATEGVTKGLANKALSEAAKAGGVALAEKAGESWLLKTVKFAGSKTVGLFVTFVLSDSYGGGWKGHTDEMYYINQNNKPKPEPQSQPQPKPDPRKVPDRTEDGEEGYYVYKTASADKLKNGYVDKSAISLPYYGITKGAVIGGRYSASNERSINLTMGNNGIIAQTNYYTAGGVESALVIFNTYGIGMLNSKSLKSLVRNAPALSTRIDNKTITFTDVARIMSGVLWLNKNIPDWKTRFNEKENKKGPNHPDNKNNQ